MEALLNLLLDTESKNDSLLLYMSQKRKRMLRRRRILIQNIKWTSRRIPKIQNFFSVIKKYPADKFINHFHMSRSTFKLLIDALRPYWPNSQHGRCGVPLDRCLYITLWKLCNDKVPFRQLGDMFNVGKGTAHDMFFKTIKAICNLQSEISWPTVDEQYELMKKFQNDKGNPIPHVIGCIDSIRYKIATPKKDATNYCDKNGNQSIIMQAICDNNYRFLDVYIGNAGSWYNSLVWENSPINKAITDDEIDLAQNAIILGDSTYHLSKFLMVPYNTNESLRNDQLKFNNCLNSTRVCVQHALRILQQNFKILNYIDIDSSKARSDVITACVILHNFIISKDDALKYIVVDINDLDNDNEDNQNIQTYIKQETDKNIDGIAMRNYLTKVFFS